MRDETRILAIWRDQQVFNLAGLDACLRAVDWPTYDELWVVGNAKDLERVGDVLEHREMLPILGNVITRLVELPAGFRDARGSFEWTAEAPDLPEMLSRMVSALIVSEGCLVDARSHAYHYVTPSRAHQSFFVRIGNAIRTTSVIRLLATASLIRALDTIVSTGQDTKWPPRHVYVDSSTILAVAMEMAKLLSDDHHEVDASVFRAETYQEQLTVPLEASLLVESVAVSGRFEEAVHEIAGANRTPLHISRLVDLTDQRENDASFIESAVTDLGELGDALRQLVWTSRDCPLCARGIPQVRIAPETFLFDRPSASYHNLVAAHASGDLELFIVGALGTNCIGVSGAPRRPARLRAGARTIGTFDLTQATALARASSGLPTGNSLVDGILELARAIAAQEPGTIVVGNDPIANEIVLLSREHFALGSQVSTLTLNGLLEKESVQGPIAVVLPVIESGSEAESISASLRDRAPGSPISYHCLIAKQLDHYRSDALSSNLTFDGKRKSHNFEPVFILPHVPFWEVRHHPWKHELEVLDTAPVRDFPGASARAEHVRGLLTDSGPFGFRTSLFLPDSNSPTLDPASALELSLQDGFALWPHDTDCTLATHADVLYTISFVLERMRRGGRRTDDYARHRCDLCGKMHETSVSIFAVLHQDYNGSRIDPGAFRRLSDGVIQAAMLRAGRAIEFDYSGSRVKSLEMAEIILESAGSTDEKKGNALPEFMLALDMANPKMQLEPEVFAGLRKALDNLGLSKSTVGGAMLRRLIESGTEGEAPTV